MALGGRGEVKTQFSLIDLGKSEHLEDLGVDVMVILKKILRKYNRMMWTGFISVRIRITGELL